MGCMTAPPTPMQTPTQTSTRTPTRSTAAPGSTRVRATLRPGRELVAAQKAAELLHCGATVTVVAPEIDPALRADDRVTCEARPYRSGEVAGYRFAVAATDDPAVNQAVYDDGEAAGVWVNAADDPARCSATLPSRVRRGSLLVTVSTHHDGGADALDHRRKTRGKRDLSGRDRARNRDPERNCHGAGRVPRARGNKRSSQYPYRERKQQADCRRPSPPIMLLVHECSITRPENRLTDPKGIRALPALDSRKVVPAFRTGTRPTAP